MFKSGGDVVLTWAAEVNDGYELRAFPRLFRSDSSVVIDRELSESSAFTTVVGPRGQPLWVFAPTPAMLRFSGLSSAVASTIYGEVTNPVFARFRVVADRESGSMLLTGGTGSAGNSVVSLLIRYRVDCS